MRAFNLVEAPLARLARCGGALRRRASGRYETLSGGDYIILGAALALPCYLGPAAIAGTVWPTDWSYHFKFNLWIGILGKWPSQG